MRRTIIVFCLVIAGILFSITVVKRMYAIYQSGTRLTREADEIASLEGENEELRRKLDQANSLEFIEREARDKLNFSLPGETTVVLPRPQSQEARTISVMADKPNWRRWWYLFFE